MNLIYPKAREAFGKAGIDLINDTIKCVLIDLADYTYDAAHDNLDDVASGARVGTPQALANKSMVDGVFDADDVVFPTVVGDPCEAVLIYKDTGTESTSKLIALLDGKAQVEIAVNASGGATAIVPEDLPADIANGATLTKISGTGPSTITTSASASAGARALSVAALGSGITAGALYEYARSGAGVPVSPNGGDINCPWNNGAFKIFAL